MHSSPFSSHRGSFVQRNLNVKLNATFTTARRKRRSVACEMKWAFVLTLGSGTKPCQRQIEGWIEEVDTGRELRFRNTDELLVFLCQRFISAQERGWPYAGEDEPAAK